MTGIYTTLVPLTGLAFILASDSIYTGSGTVPTTTVATITDTINFTGGNFGIGVTPTEKLHVNGNTKIDGDTTINGIFRQNTTNTSAIIAAWVKATSNSASGQIFITETTSGEFPLNVNNAGFVKLGGAGTNIDSARLQAIGFGTTSSTTNTVFTGSTLGVGFRIMDDGSTGIGLGSVLPSAKLHVDGTVILDNLPTSAPATSGALWNNSGVINIVP